jgi:hypothetical protein
MNKQKLILPVSILLGCIILGWFYYASQTTTLQNTVPGPYEENSPLLSLGTDSSDINSETNIKIEVTAVKVNSFYNGEEGFSLSIPSGNNSTCIWTYSGGNAVIPYKEITNANTATGKHTILSSDFYDFMVLCVDDWGNRFIGVFPK